MRHASGVIGPSESATSSSDTGLLSLLTLVIPNRSPTTAWYSRFSSRGICELAGTPGTQTFAGGAAPGAPGAPGPPGTADEPPAPIAEEPACALPPGPFAESPSPAPELHAASAQTAPTATTVRIRVIGDRPFRHGRVPVLVMSTQHEKAVSFFLPPQ